MKNSLPSLDPQDESEGVKTFSERVSLFSNQTYKFISPHQVAYLVLFSLYILYKINVQGVSEKTNPSKRPLFYKVANIISVKMLHI